MEVGGTLDVHSYAEENFQAAAVGNSADSTGVGIGGAVAVNEIANQASSFIGHNAIVDVFGDITLVSDALVTNPMPVFDPDLSLVDSDVMTGQDRVAEQFADADAVAATVGAQLGGLEDPAGYDLNSFLADPDSMGSSFVHAGGDLPEGQVGIAGGVSALNVYNQAASGIASGARVNQRGLAGDADQDVTARATGTLQIANLAGLDSAINLTDGGSGTADAVGGYFGGIFADNYARAYIDDRARVTAEHDVRLESLTQNDLLQVVQAGAEGQDVGVDGSFSVVVLGQESLAYIEDRAIVEAGHDVVLDADNAGAVTNIAGAVANGRDVAVGASAAVTIVREAQSFDEGGVFDEELDGFSKTHAFIGDAFEAVGDAFEAVGATGTGGLEGSVRAGNDLILDADSALESWSASMSGGASGGGFDHLGPREASEGLAFGVGVSGDVSFNQLNYSVQSFIRDSEVIEAGNGVLLTADDNPLLVSGAGAVVFGNHFGIGGALAYNGQNALVRAYTRDTKITAPTVEVLATARDSVMAVSNGGAANKASLTVGGSVNLNRINNVAEAVIDARSDVEAGTVTVNAHSTLTSVSTAGASSASAHGFLAVGGGRGPGDPGERGPRVDRRERRSDHAQ